MNPVSHALKIISIQHELSMSMGIGLKLDDMLETFMARAQQRLSLSCVHVLWDLPSSKSTQSISFPASNSTLNPLITAKSEDVYQQQLTSYDESFSDNSHHYFFLVPKFGVLILERLHSSIDKDVINALTSLMTKLATSCLACIHHQSLVDEIKTRRKIEKKLRDQYFIDPLTQLPNREMFKLNLKTALSNAIRSGRSGAVFYIDVDRFKTVNDSLGHTFGDCVLKEIGMRLKQCVREGDTLARIEGDEFALLVVDLDEDPKVASQKATRIAEKLSYIMTRPVTVDKNELLVTISTGINTFPVKEHQKSSTEQQVTMLIKNADLAMYKVKHSTRNGFGFFSADLQAYSDKRAKIEKSLREALQHNEFEVYYQPLVNKDSSILGAEALIRWQSKTLGFVSPAEFIPIAEECGLIIPIGDWVLEEVCKIVHELTQKRYAQQPKYISVNISPRQFAQANFTENVLHILHKYQVPPDKLRIEITENVAIDNMDLTIAKMLILKEKGIEIMLDDFGSGYSSLSYLHKLPLKTIKIDRSFITDIDISVDNQVITCSIVDICEHFSMECIVEGVENEKERCFLMDKSVTAFQGFHFYRPMPSARFLALFDSKVQVK